MDTAFSTNVYKKMKQKSDQLKQRTLPDKVLQKVRTRKEKFAFLRELQRRGANGADIEVAEEKARQAEQDERNNFHVMRESRKICEDKEPLWRRRKSRK